jgi:hypothetical protein
MYFLTFFMGFDRDKGLDNGRLNLRHLELGTINTWIATSSVESKQGAEDFHERGGLIPPEYRVPGLKNWTVATKPIPMPQTKGVEGNFYKIDPHNVTTDKGGARGDFGIHLDANVPGSMGCIVMTKERFNGFEKQMDLLADQGIRSIPLFVTYS